MIKTRLYSSQFIDFVLLDFLSKTDNLQSSPMILWCGGAVVFHQEDLVPILLHIIHKIVNICQKFTQFILTNVHRGQHWPEPCEESQQMYGAVEGGHDGPLRSVPQHVRVLDPLKLVQQLGPERAVEIVSQPSTYLLYSDCLLGRTSLFHVGEVVIDEVIHRIPRWDVH